MTPTDFELTKYLVGLGVGGALAAVIFFFYRRDVRSYTELWKEATDMLMETVKENTVSNTQLVDVIKSLHDKIENRTTFR